MSGAPNPDDAAVRSPAASDTRRDAVLTRSLRYEIAGDEGRALLGSYAFAFALGIAWLLIVYFGPKTLPMQLLARDEQPIAVTFDALEPLPGGGAPGEEGEAIRTPAPSRNAGAGSRSTTARAGAIAAAFGSANGTGTGGMVGDVSNVLRNVDVSSGAGGTGAGAAATSGGATGGKVVLGSGEGGQGSRTPGRGNIGGTTGIGGAAGGIGGVGPGGGTVSRAPVRISPPRPIDAPAVRGVQRDVGELGTFVRGRESQLRFCYNEYGLKVNPSLAGSVSASIALTPAGDVSGVDITNRTWSGAGAGETERCIAEKIRGWRFPASEAGGGTYGFSFSFTR